MFQWFKKWKKQPMPIQWIIFNYAIYLIVIIISTVYAYAILAD